MNVYDFINWFFMYSFLGYLLECIAVSYTHLDVYKRQAVWTLMNLYISKLISRRNISQI